MFLIKRIIYLILISLILTSCGEPDVYDMLEKMEKEEAQRLKNLTPEERKAEEDLAAQKKAEEEAKLLAEIEQAEWESKHTDLIYYRISRYSSDGKFIDKDKYILHPLSEQKLQIHGFKNRGFKEDLDTNGIIVNSAFLGGVPTSKFDIYAIIWSRENHSRTSKDKIRVEIAYKDISRTW